MYFHDSIIGQSNTMGMRPYARSGRSQCKTTIFEKKGSGEAKKTKTKKYGRARQTSTSLLSCENITIGGSLAMPPFLASNAFRYTHSSCMPAGNGAKRERLPCPQHECLSSLRRLPSPATWRRRYSLMVSAVTPRSISAVSRLNASRELQEPHTMFY